MLFTLLMLMCVLYNYKYCNYLTTMNETRIDKCHLTIWLI